jgi:hypothetical protein
LHNPEESNAKITLAEIFDENDLVAFKEKAKETIISRQIQDRMYKHTLDENIQFLINKLSGDRIEKCRRAIEVNLGKLENKVLPSFFFYNKARNLHVHRSGRIDDEFLTYGKTSATKEFIEVREGKQFLKFINGFIPIVKDQYLKAVWFLDDFRANVVTLSEILDNCLFEEFSTWI